MILKVASILVLAAIVSSGCLGGTASGDDAVEEAVEPAAVQDVNVPNKAPTAALAANRTTGPSPLSITFSLNSSDDDGDALDWTFDAGDGTRPITGGDFPWTVNWTYAPAGEYVASLVVDDGNATDRRNVTIVVTEPPPEPPSDRSAAANEDGTDVERDDGSEHVVINGTALIGNPAHPFACLRGGFDGNMHEIAPAGPGWWYELDQSGTFAVYWWSDEEFLDQGEDAGTVPADATRAEVCMREGNVQGRYSMTLQP